MTAPSAKRIPALMLVLLSIVAAFAIYDSTRMRIDRRDSTLHSSTASARPTLTRPSPTGSRPATGPVTRPPPLGSAATRTPSAQGHTDSGDPVRTVLTVGLIIVGGVTALTVGAMLLLVQLTRRRRAGPPLT